MSSTLDSQSSATSGSNSCESSPEGPSAVLVTKHPLQNDWDFWYYKMEKQKDWLDCLMKIASFNSVEDFWAVYNHIEVPSMLAHHSDYNVFKHGIKPMWEDERNMRGGRLVFLVRKNAKKELDTLWLEILLCLIGEAFGEESDQICGAVVNIRPRLDRISVWTSDLHNEPAIRKIASVIKERTRYQGQISYEPHKDSPNKSGNPLYVL